jgi:hypothetical protein
MESPDTMSIEGCAARTCVIPPPQLTLLFAQPIPLELLTLVSFSESPQQRSSSLLGNFRGRNTQHAEGAPNGGGSEPVDSRLLYPCSIHHSGRVGGHYHLFAESAQARAEWERKLNEAVVLRKAVQDANQVSIKYDLEAMVLIMSFSRCSRKGRSARTLSSCQASNRLCLRHMMAL